MGDEARLVRIVVGAEADTAKLRAFVVVAVVDPVETQLILEQITEQPGKAPGGQGLAPGVIDPGPVMRVEPAVLLFIAIGLVQLVRTPRH